MKKIDKSIFSSRLKMARKMAGMSLQDLSDKLLGKVSKQSLSKYELGVMLPSDEILNHISNVLNIRPDYFFRSNSIELDSVCFRKNSNLSKTVEESIVGKSKDYIERYYEIESILGLNNQFNNPILGVKIESFNDVEIAAKTIRERWNLGNNAVSNIRQLLELKGIKVYTIEQEDGFDGASFLAEKNQPIIVVNVKDKSNDRIRFTMLHELAHIILGLNNELSDDFNKNEKMCHRFASRFLLPADRLIELIGGNKRGYIKINELISIKESYGISIRAILFSLKEMEVINEIYYRKWMVYLSKNFGIKNEPGNYNQRENISVFEQMVYRAYAEGIISISKAAYLLNVNINDLRKGKVNE